MLKDHKLKSWEQFDEIKRLIYAATGCKNFWDLAGLLGVTPAQISDARRQLIIPESWIRVVERVNLTKAGDIRRLVGE